MDGPHHYPDSKVRYMEFESRECRRMFAYLRQKEEILQNDIRGQDASDPLIRSKIIRLYEVENQLMWMIVNATPFSYPEEIEE